MSFKNYFYQKSFIMPPQFRIGILRETRQPPDLRVPFSPAQCRRIMQEFPNTEVIVQPSPFRSYTDMEYSSEGILLTEDLSSCDLLLGIKEVEPGSFLEDKCYLFFAHVGKKQAHNRRLLQAMLHKRITLIDYEYLTDERKNRVVAFGHWAGIVGAYNALRGWGLRNNLYSLKPAWQCYDYRELIEQVAGLRTGPIRVLLTGEGRVASGAIEILINSGFPRLNPDEYLEKRHVTGFCQLGPQHYVKHREGRTFEFSDFVRNPSIYDSNMSRFLPLTDMLITGHFWDPRSPVFFTPQQVADKEFRPSLIADISCDVDGPIPVTLRASSISSPFYDVNRYNLTERPAFSDPLNITMMAVDNLPAELPRDASVDFGNALIEKVMGNFLANSSDMLEQATIVRNGKLTPGFSYLADFAAGK
jgi:saccharopine dehydrogenase (NAD+, L-lysine forming)